jgi:ubiquitin C-terminal hydrolase
MYISLPITTGKNKVVIQELIDDFIASEIMDGDDKWNCPRCPIVIIQLKRFTTKNGVFWDKSENHVIFPMQGLDLTRYVPYRAKRGGEDMDDPRTQIGPFRYDLYGVSNHIGTLSSGHCESSFFFPLSRLPLRLPPSRSLALLSMMWQNDANARYRFRKRCQRLEIRRG